jgi:hypothetical protein
MKKEETKVPRIIYWFLVAVALGYLYVFNNGIGEVVRALPSVFLILFGGSVDRRLVIDALLQKERNYNNIFREIKYRKRWQLFFFVAMISTFSILYLTGVVGDTKEQAGLFTHFGVVLFISLSANFIYLDLLEHEITVE